MLLACRGEKKFEFGVEAWGHGEGQGGGSEKNNFFSGFRAGECVRAGSFWDVPATISSHPGPF